MSITLRRGTGLMILLNRWSMRFACTFQNLRSIFPDADFRMLNAKIPRQTIRYSGRTAMNANIAVSEPKPLQDPDSPLAFSMEGIQEDATIFTCSVLLDTRDGILCRLSILIILMNPMRR